MNENIEMYEEELARPVLRGDHGMNVPKTVRVKKSRQIDDG